jgi:hypothetical protein
LRERWNAGCGCDGLRGGVEKIKVRRMTVAGLEAKKMLSNC